MSIFLISVYAIVVLLILISVFLLLNSKRSKGSLARALNMSLFSVTLPRPAPQGSANASQRPEKELISVMEQLYGSFTNLHSKGWNRFIYGEPYLGLEIAVQHTGRDIEFYIAVPRNFEDVLEKQVHGLYPEAEIERVEDYSIFHSGSSALGAYVSLKNDSILPIKTYQKLESDPLGEILTAMSKINHEGEGASLQILFKPSHQESQRSHAQKVAQQMQRGFSLKDAMSRAKKPPKESTEAEQPRVVTVFEDEAIKNIQSKASKPWFDANVRLIVSAESEPRASQLLDILSGSLVQFSTTDQNTFGVTKLSGRYLKKLFFNFSFRMFDESTKILLSSEELASLYHFPISANTPGVKFIKSKLAPAPLNLPTTGIILGENTFRGVKTEVRMTDEDRRRHLYIIGQTGTGKSTMMKALLRQDVENGKGVCLIDPHGEFAEFVLSITPQERAEDVIYFDPGDIDFPMGLNMLEIDPAHPEQKSMVIDEMFLIFDKLYDLKTTGGPMFEKYFKNSALLLLDDYAHEAPTLADISRVLVDTAYREDKLSRETNPLVTQFWRLEADKAQGEQSLSNMAPYITSKITSFIFNEFLRPIVNQQKSAFNFRQAMDESKILVVNLSKGKIGELNANLLGMIIVGKLLMAALSRVDSDEKSRKDTYLYIDEFQNFATDSISTILSEARKYRLDLIIAHQFIKQLTDKIRDAVFGNVGSIATFRIGPDDADFMKNKFEPVFTAQDLTNIDNLNAYVNLLVNGQTTQPFNIKL
ncbi:MAG: DUF87 domain-containing protein, partial [Patescibacteria group bacterium]